MRKRAEIIKQKNTTERYEIEKKYFGRYDEWLGLCTHGPHWLGEDYIAKIVANKIHQMDGNHYRLLAYCIMPNHVHLLIESIGINKPVHQGKTATYPITDSLRLLKGSTARYCNLALHRSGTFWHHESYDHYIRNEQEEARIIRYILNNPVKAKLVEDWRKWEFTYLNTELGEW